MDCLGVDWEQEKVSSSIISFQVESFLEKLIEVVWKFQCYRFLPKYCRWGSTSSIDFFLGEAADLGLDMLAEEGLWKEYKFLLGLSEPFREFNSILISPGSEDGKPHRICQTWPKDWTSFSALQTDSQLRASRKKDELLETFHHTQEVMYLDWWSRRKVEYLGSNFKADRHSHSSVMLPPYQRSSVMGGSGFSL